MSMFNDISWGSPDNEQECELNANLVSIYAKRFPAGRWSFPGPGSEKKWYSACDCRPQRDSDRVAESMMIKFREGGLPVFRAISPLSRGTLISKGGGKFSIHFCAGGETIETVFRTIITVNQPSIYGAVSDLCEEYKACHVRTVRLVMAGQSGPLSVPTSSVMKALTLSTDDPAQEDLLQKYQERVERLPQQNRVIKICADAGFLTAVDVGQYFMTQDTEKFSQFTESVACRDYTLPRDEKSSDPKGWIRGNREWNIPSHLPHPREPVDTTTTIPMHERRWIDIEPSEQTLAAYDLSKKVISLLRHNQTVQREEDGAIEFCRIKFHLRSHSSQVRRWSGDRWKACLAAGGGSKRRYQYCSDNSGRIHYLRALQGHSGHNLIDPTLQDNVVIGSGIFHHIYHIGCAFNLHSIINNGLIPGGQDLSRRQTVFFLPIDPRDKNHKDLEYIDFSVPRRARYVHSAWKRHQDAVFWVDIDLAIREGLTFYQTRSNAIILQGTFPVYCIPKVVRLNTGEVLYERPYLSPRPPPKISLRHDHNWTRGNDQLGSTGEQQPVGKLVQQSFGEAPRVKLSKPTQSKPNPICGRSGKPEDTERDFVDKGKTSRSHEIDDKRLHTKNLALQIDRGNLIICLKTFASSMFTMEQGNLWSQAAQAHT